MARLLPGRFVFGIGSSSRPIVEQWNGIPHVEPFRRVAETLELLDELLTTGRATGSYTTISVDGFQLPNLPEIPPRLGVGALGPKMQRLAARRADWVQTGMLIPGDVARVKDNIASVERTRAGRAELHVGVRIAPGDPETSTSIRSLSDRVRSSASPISTAS